MEMGGRGWAHWRGATFKIHLIVDQSPLLQEGMDSVKEQYKLSSSGLDTKF